MFCINRFIFFFIQVLDLRGDLPRKFLDYSNYGSLNTAETLQLLELCKLLAPDVLTNKCIFEMDDLAGSSNRFFELSSAKSTMVATDSIMIGGKSIKVAKIMAYTRAWRRNNYDLPLVSCTRSLTSSSLPSTRRSAKRDSCILL